MPAMRPPRSSLALSFCSDSLDCRANAGVRGRGRAVKPMGRAARWLRGLLSGKKAGAGESSGEHKEKRRWGFGKSFREKERQHEQQRQRKGEPPRPEASPAVSEDRKGSYREVHRPYGSVPPATGARVVDEEEQNKRAIAVAAATAAVAEAAVAAAQAAAVVVRLTTSGRTVAGLAVGKREELAATKIQSAFRGYLARRALRALRGLVKLQALVRGNIVRKQAAETLRCMQALVRVQARAQACRALRSERSRSEKLYCRSQAGPPTPEKYEQAVRANALSPSCTLKRNSSKPAGMHVVECDRASTAAWNWLDRWMEERYWDSREAAKKAASFGSMDDEKNAKILEVDPGKPQFSHRRSNHPQYCSNLVSDHHSHSFTAVPDSPSKDSMTIQQSVPSPVSVDMQQCLSSLRFPLEVVDFSESPQFYSASSRHANARKSPFTPSKSDCSRSLFSGYSDYPNYMSNTESSKAKVRSQSAPRQRPELDKAGSIKRPSAHGYAHHSQAALAQRSSSLHAKFANKAYPGSGRLDRLGMPLGNC